MECKKHIQTDKYENKKKLNNIDHDVEKYLFWPRNWFFGIFSLLKINDKCHKSMI